MIREEELKRSRLHRAKRASAATTTKESREDGPREGYLEQFQNDENHSNANGSPLVVTEKR